MALDICYLNFGPRELLAVFSGVAGLLESTAEFRDAVHLLHSLTCCWFEVHQFEWIHVELAWNNFFAMMDERSALTKAEVIWQ